MFGVPIPVSGIVWSTAPVVASKRSSVPAVESRPKTCGFSSPAVRPGAPLIWLITATTPGGAGGGPGFTPTVLSPPVGILLAIALKSATNWPLTLVSVLAPRRLVMNARSTPLEEVEVGGASPVLVRNSTGSSRRLI